MRKRTMLIKPEWDGRKVKSILRREFGMADIFISRVKLRPEGIMLNGKRAFTDALVHDGDQLTVELGDETGRNEAQPIKYPLSVVYEDEDLAVIDKAPGMAVHGSTGGCGVTVANALAYRWGAEQTFHPVNRLDRGTSGLMIVAKSAYAHERLRRILHTDDFIREYIAVAEGVFEETEGSITLPIGKDPAAPTRRCISADGQAARTDYTVLRQTGSAALVRLRLYTGRTHQIRVHLAAVGHPLLGDTLYGNSGNAFFSRPALHSEYLRLRHPVTGEILELRSPLPEDMKVYII